MKVILAVDHSMFSEQALQTLIAQISPQHTEVRVLHVVEPISMSAPPQMAADYAPEMAGEFTEGHKLVKKAAETLRLAGFKVETAVEQGGIREKIIDYAAAWHADLIVLGSHGRTGLGRFLLGSVAESVARHAPCSVEIVRLPAGA